MADGRPLVGVVGSGIAGLRAVEAMQQCGVDARVVIFGDETYRTYNRPSLTKKGFSVSDAVGLPIAAHLEPDGPGDGPTWRLGTRVEAADLRRRTLRLSTGEQFPYDRLVIASGVRPRTLSRSSTECELHVHRTFRGLDDAQYIHQELRTRKTVTIVGSGFVGCEVASLAGGYSCDVVMLEAVQPGPFSSLLGERISSVLSTWLIENGVTFLTGEPANRLLCDGRIVTSGAASGPEPSSRPDRALYVEAIGSIPNVEWLHGNGLDLSDGVCVDEHMRVPGREDVFAAGDVARYPDPWAPAGSTRFEFWKNAIDTGKIAGRSLAASLGCPTTPSRIAYFPIISTELFGLRVQIGGSPGRADSVETVCGDLDRLEQGVVVSFRRGGTIVGVAYLDTGARFHRDYITLLTSVKKELASAPVR